MSEANLPQRLRQLNAVICNIDLKRTTRVLEEINDRNRFILFLDEYYGLCSEAVTAEGGEVVKYMGDGCLAMFSEDNPVSALDAIARIEPQIGPLCERYGCTPTHIRAALHVGEFVVGTFGPEGYQDALGSAVNAVFTIESKGRIAASEAFYRKLPNDRRSPFRKKSHRVTYVID